MVRSMEEHGRPLEVEIPPEIDPQLDRGLDRSFEDAEWNPEEMTEAPFSERYILGRSNGLGLTIVKRLCELLDGSFYLTSRHGEGVRVRIVFPTTLKLLSPPNGGD